MEDKNNEDDESIPLRSSDDIGNNESMFSKIEWDDSRFVWDLTELEHINKTRKENGEPLIEIVKKPNDVDGDLGIRAHPELGIGKSLLSIFMPHHNEFIF